MTSKMYVNGVVVITCVLAVGAIGTSVNLTDFHIDDYDQPSGNIDRQLQLTEAILNHTSELKQQMSTVMAMLHGEYKLCPNPWFTGPDACYVLVGRRLSWLDAKQSCEDIGADLLSIKGSEENDRYALLFDHAKDPVWIGAFRFYQNDDWQWSDGSEWTYSGLQEDASNKQKAHRDRANGCMQFERGVWKIKKCKRHTSGFVCKLKLF